MSGHFHISSELISGIIVSAFLKTNNLNNKAIYDLSQLSKMNLNLSVQSSKNCFRMESAFIWNLFQKGYPSTLIDTLKHSVQWPELCFQIKNL